MKKFYALLPFILGFFAERCFPKIAESPTAFYIVAGVLACAGIASMLTKGEISRFFGLTSTVFPAGFFVSFVITQWKLSNSSIAVILFLFLVIFTISLLVFYLPPLHVERDGGLDNRLTGFDDKCPRCGGPSSRSRRLCNQCDQPQSESELSPLFSGNVSVKTAPIVIALTLLFTNPSESDFKHEMTDRIRTSTFLQTGTLNDVLATRILTLLISQSTERRNFYFFSVFEIDNSSFKLIIPNTPRLRYLGILGAIIPLF